MPRNSRNRKPGKHCTSIEFMKPVSGSETEKSGSEALSLSEKGGGSGGHS